MPLDIKKRLNSVKATIQQIESKYERLPNSVSLLAVSKTKSVKDIQQAITEGQCAFGESYVQEAIEKIRALENKNLCWHFIGPIQKNKTKLIAEHFHWVHSVDRLIVAERLNNQRPHSLQPLQVCIQVNINNENTKSGISLEQVENLAHTIRNLPKIKLRGLMAIPQMNTELSLQRECFAKLRNKLDQLNTIGFELDTLSMGMSNDLEAAIAEGATIIRVGTAIFGQRA